ncbi:MAG TPA: DNA-directed RNA polymerase subunit L [Methanocorpusculum sp.]|nr:DNA-directed RNA polymerase subunit L [Methanocorpusculum sp.]
MKVKILEHEKDKLRFVIEGEGHTFVNALVEEALLDPEVDLAKYVIEFQFSDPEVLITMKPKSKKTPEKVVKEVLKKISTSCDDLLECLKN